MSDVPVVADLLFPVAARFVDDSDMVISAVMVFEVLRPNGVDANLVTINSEMPWWRVNGMLEGGKQEDDE